MKHIKLYESFDEDDVQVWYHGAGRPDKDFVKSMDFVGAEEASDDQGPGLYLTADPDDAAGYGKHIYTINLDSEGRIIRDDDELAKEDFENAIKIIKEYSEEWEMHAQNYDENPEAGLDQFLHATQLDATHVKDFYISVWYEFFRHHGVEFVKGMNAVGIDAVITAAYRGQAKDGNMHAIVYNGEIIDVVSQSERKAQ